jgi:ribosomal protein S27E
MKDEKEDSTIKCPNCDELNMVWDEVNQMWQCLSCGHRETE